MATKITITLPDDQLAEIKRRVKAGWSKNVSDYLQDIVQKSFDNEVAFDAMLEESLMKSGGPATAKELAWARRMLKPKKRSARRRAA
jgi:Arc/MetJ-type ribon-helix-helix transcriptional regulator